VEPETLAPLAVDAPRVDGTVITLTGTAMTGAARQLREVLVYARGDDGAERIVGRTTVSAAAPDAMAPFAGQFARTAFTIALESLPPGSYDLRVVARSAVSADLDTTVWARGVRVQ
jgi:hypothetical protein